MTIIAHGLSTIKLCDMVYVMENGKIIEEGSHEQLLGIDAKLWEQQTN